MANYTYTKDGDYRYITTKANNITTKIIDSNLCSTAEYGINGGFFAKQDKADPTFTLGVSMSWIFGNPYGNNVNANKGGGFGGTYEVSRGTFAIFEENGISKCLIGSAPNITRLVTDYGIAGITRVAIGGGHFALRQTEDYWKNTIFPSEELSCKIDDGVVNPPRTALGFKVINNEWHVYLVVNRSALGTGITLTALRNYMKNTLGCVDAIFLDGSGSTQIQCKEYSNDGDKRRIHNAVTLINK